MIDVETFVSLPFHKQLHICALKWLHNQNMQAYSKGKPVPEYFVCRAMLLKLDRQTIKNITLMLDDTDKPVPLNKLESRADQFIRRQQTQVGKVKSPARKEYDISVKEFLNR